MTSRTDKRQMFLDALNATGKSEVTLDDIRNIVTTNKIGRAHV